MKFPSTAALLLALASPLIAAREPFPKGGSLETALSLFKEDQVDAAKRKLFAEAFNILTADKATTFADLGNNPEFQKLCAKHGLTHLGGPLLGDVKTDGVKVWVRTLKPAAVEVRVTVGESKKIFGPVRSSAESDLAAIVPVTGLEPATTYSYEVLIDGKAITIPESAAITTAPADNKVRIAFGTCPHRVGLNNQEQADLVRARKPTALLMYGDIAAQDRTNHLGGHRADYLLRDFQPAWQSMVASIPVYATWDDHDYLLNY